MPIVEIKGVGKAQFPDDMDINDIRDFLRKKYYQDEMSGVSKALDPAPQTASSYEPTLAEKMGQGIASGLKKTGLVSDNYGAQRIGKNVSALAELLPGIGDATAGDEFGRAVAKGDNLGMAMAGLGVIPVAGDAAKKGVKKLYHGSAFDFKEPSLDSYMSGEGGGGFGYGFHSTASKRTMSEYSVPSPLVEIDGREYWGNTVENPIAQDLLDDGYGHTLAKYTEVAKENPDSVFAKKKIEILKGLKDSSVKDLRGSGFEYEVEIPQDKINSYMRWEDLLEEQPDSVRAILDEEGLIEGGKTGKDLYYELADDLGGEFDGDKEASEFLNDIGIGGINYNDPIESSFRSGGDASDARNFTTFDVDTLNIKPIKQSLPI